MFKEPLESYPAASIRTNTVLEMSKSRSCGSAPKVMVKAILLSTATATLGMMPVLARLLRNVYLSKDLYTSSYEKIK